MCEPEVTHKKREVSKLRRQVCRHITKLRLWQKRPYTVAEVTSRPGWNGAPPGEGAELTAVAVAKVGYPDRWQPLRGQKIAVGKATKLIAQALWAGKAHFDVIVDIPQPEYIQRLTGVPLGFSGQQNIKIQGPMAGKIRFEDEDEKPVDLAEPAGVSNVTRGKLEIRKLVTPTGMAEREAGFVTPKLILPE